MCKMRGRERERERERERCRGEREGVRAGRERERTLAWHWVFSYIINLQDRVQEQQISGNQDAPEGGFDGFLQSIVCTDLIGWRNVSRKLLLYITDAGFHYANDGKVRTYIQLLCITLHEVHVEEICPLVYEVELSKGHVHVYWCFDQVYDNSISVKITQFIWLSAVIYISIVMHVHVCTCTHMSEWAARVGVIFIVSKIHTHCVDMLISLWNVPFSKRKQSTPYIHIYSSEHCIPFYVILLYMCIHVHACTWLGIHVCDILP